MRIWKQEWSDFDVDFYGEDLIQQFKDIKIRDYIQEQEDILLACLSAGVNMGDISIYVQKRHDGLNFTEAATIVIGGHKETVELSV